MAGTFGGDGILGKVQDENRVSVTDNSGNSLYGKVHAAGPDGMYSFQPGNALDNANDSSIK